MKIVSINVSSYGTEILKRKLRALKFTPFCVNSRSIHQMAYPQSQYTIHSVEIWCKKNCLQHIFKIYFSKGHPFLAGGRFYRFTLKPVCISDYFIKFKTSFVILNANKDDILSVFEGATVAEWQHSCLPPLRPGFGSRHALKWESW